MMDSKTISFTAANSIPVKIFKDVDLVYDLNNGLIPPIHVQLIPTNRCNLKCSFCSCRKRNMNDELTLDQIETLCENLEIIGCKAATVTGGGEPLIHADISLILDSLCNHGIKVGLVTNGLLLHRLSREDFDKITWCRISCADERSFDKARDVIEVAVKCGCKVDWAFSYVVGRNFNPENLNKYIAFANEYNFTHVRVVSDLLNLSNVKNMDEIKPEVTVDDSRVIYQGRKEFDPGQKDCRISLLKPVIGADGFIYPCCGVQYAHFDEDLDNPRSMQMGRMEDIVAIYREQVCFNGVGCYRCYYKNYNDILGQMVGKMEHLEFV
jgi:MoaA/NifB/PqqE/SkfB family radical SAM enzyme